MASTRKLPSIVALPNWADALWLCALGLYVMTGAALVPFHGDESTQIFMGRDVYYLLEEGDLSKVLYNPAGASSPIEQHLRLVNGTITKSIHGWLALRNGLAADEINLPWDWEQDYAWNRAANRIPDSELLRGARLASSLHLALAVAAFFAFARICADRPTAYVASALFALNPTVLLNGRRAMMEGPLLLGMMLALLAAAWLMHERKWWNYALLGIVSGFAISAKHPNAAVVALTFLALASWTGIESLKTQGQRREAVMKTAAGLVAAAMLTAAIFLTLNPAWWRSPLAAASETMSERLRLLDTQVEHFGGYESGMEKVIGFWRHVFVGETLYFEAESWANVDEIKAQIETYENSGWAGAKIGGGVAAGLLSSALTAAGTLHFARDRRISPGLRWLIVVWGGGIALITTLVTPLTWERYYLPVLPFVHFATAWALTTTLRFIWKRLKARSKV